MSLFQDLPANRLSDDPGRPERQTLLATLLTMRYAATFLYRLSARVGRMSSLAGSVVKQINHLVTGADIAWTANIGPGLVTWHPTGVVIGPGTTIGRNCAIQQGVTIGAARSKRSPKGEPVIGDDVYLGAGSRLLGRLTVGSGARIGANAVVLGNVPPGAVAVGVPARILT